MLMVISGLMEQFASLQVMLYVGRRESSGLLDESLSRTKVRLSVLRVFCHSQPGFRREIACCAGLLTSLGRPAAGVGGLSASFAHAAKRREGVRRQQPLGLLHERSGSQPVRPIWGN